jgi:hypothetical protein
MLPSEHCRRPRRATSGGSCHPPALPPAAFRPIRASVGHPRASADRLPARGGTQGSPANVNGITAAKVMPIVPKATYVFDLRYHDYARWAALDDAECRIVTRLEKNTALRVSRTRPVAEGGKMHVAARRNDGAARGHIVAADSAGCHTVRASFTHSDSVNLRGASRSPWLNLANADASTRFSSIFRHDSPKSLSPSAQFSPRHPPLQLQQPPCVPTRQLRPVLRA